MFDLIARSPASIPRVMYQSATHGRAGTIGRADMGAMAMVYFDPYDPSLIDDPYPVYRRLRDDAPAYYGGHRNFWALSRFADVKMALADHETFCSSQGL